MNRALAGRRILLTRPGEQAEPLAARLREQGAEVSHFPAIRITLTPPDPANLERIKQATLLIFVSINAVRGLMAEPSPFARAARQASAIAAIGPATKAALEQAGLEPVVAGPPPHNSEALLSTPLLQDMQSRRVVIVQGHGGREKLAEELRHRGAEVHRLEVYRRDSPDTALSLNQTSGGPPDAICVTSVEIAENLLKCIAVEEKDDLTGCALIAGNERIAAACRNLGYTAHHEVADNPGDDAMHEALIAYFSQSPLP